MMDLREAGEGNSLRHPWETARFKFFTKILSRTKAFQGKLTLLDVGAGDTWFSDQLLEHLKPGSEIICWDQGYGQSSGKASGSHLQRTREQPDKNVDVVLMLDLLEHVEDDQGFLRAVVDKNVKPKGYVLVSVPSWPMLFSDHDRHLLHRRRYRPSQARRLLEATGLKILAQGGVFHSLVLVRLIQVLLEKLRGPATTHHHLGNWSHGALVTKMLEVLLGCDNQISLGFSRLHVNLPGLSWWALCQKR